MSTVSFQITHAISSHLVYLYEKDEKSDCPIIIPLKQELYDTLKIEKIEATFDEKKGMQIQINNGREALYVLRLLNDPANLTSLFYNTFQGWYDLFPNQNLADSIFNKDCELTCEETFAINYKNSHPSLKPDLKLNQFMPGLHNDILTTSLDSLMNAEDYFKKIIDESFDHCESYPIRKNDSLCMDLGFRQCTKDILNESPPTNTFYIVNTGHSIPVGALLLSEYQIPVTVFMRTVGLSTPSIHRIFTQLTTFGHEISNSPLEKTTSCQSFAWLLDCHVGEVANYDKQRGRNIIDFTAKTYTNRMPNITQLNEKGIKKIVLLIEYSPQSIVTIDDLKTTGYSSMYNYINTLHENGFEVVIKGIDSRKDFTKVLSNSNLVTA